jgi:protease II
LQETLLAEMKGRVKEDGSSAPDPDRPYAYYVRYRKGGAGPAACKRTAAMDLPLSGRVDRGDHQRYFFVPSRKRPEKSGHFHRNR